MTKLILSALGATILIVGAVLMLPPQTRTQPASASQTTEFDHSTCQYPDRTTNPPNGCDNSDPCDPANAAKGGSGECEQPAPKSAPSVSKEPVSVSKPTVNQCGGK